MRGDNPSERSPRIVAVDLDVDDDVDDARTRTMAGRLAESVAGSGRVDGVRLLARDGGVPVGSALVIGPLPGDDELLRRVRRRTEPLPDRSDGPPLAITVVVCTRDRPVLLTRCLDSLRDTVAAAGDEAVADLLVIDNAPTDDLTREVALQAGARWVCEPVPGLNFGRNRAVAECRGEVLAFVDDDVVVDRMWLRTLVRTFASDATIDAVTGGVLAFRFETSAQLEFERAGGFSTGWQTKRFAQGLGDDLPFRTGIGAGCNMAFRTSLLERIGAFDEALDTGRPMPGGGDLDILVRTVMTGTLVHEPSAVVFHDHRVEWAQLRYQYYTWGKCWAALLAKWYPLVPEHRAQIRWVAGRTMRGYARAFVARDRSERYRRWHCVLLAVGFVTGWFGTYGRSQRRVAERVRRHALTVGRAAPT